MRVSRSSILLQSGALYCLFSDQVCKKMIAKVARLHSWDEGMVVVGGRLEARGG